MGTISGDLSVLGFANLLEMLTLGQNQGHLIIEGATHQKVFYLNAGRVRLVHGSRRCARLDGLLRRIGPVTLNLTEGGEVIRRILKEWLLEEVVEVFGWYRSTFTFHEGVEIPPGVLALPCATNEEADVEVMTVLLDAARRTDDVPRIRALIPDLEMIPERNDHVEVDDSTLDTDVLRDVLPLVDGMRSVRQIVMTSAFPRHSVLHVLYRMRLQGAIVVGSGHRSPEIQVPEMA
jgi:hypothetical protein